MHGNIQSLLTEFKNMNGSLRDTKRNFEKHEEESKIYRRKVDIVWAVVHSVKWVIIFVFGTGVFWKWIAK